MEKANKQKFWIKTKNQNTNVTQRRRNRDRIGLNRHATTNRMTTKIVWLHSYLILIVYDWVSSQPNHHNRAHAHAQLNVAKPFFFLLAHRSFEPFAQCECGLHASAAYSIWNQWKSERFLSPLNAFRCLLLLLRSIWIFIAAFCTRQFPLCTF